MRPADLAPLILSELPPGEDVIAPDPGVAGALLDQGWQVRTGPIVADLHRPAGAVLLLAGEVAELGERGPTLVDTAVRALRPGGTLAVAVASAVHAKLTGPSTDRSAALHAADLRHVLEERGVDVHLLAGPGAAARVAGRAWRGLDDLAEDRVPGLVDAGPVVLAVGHSPRSSTDRSRVFWRSIARKILAASVVCVDDRQRLLVVFDVFKRSWTLPGGLVDAGESPADAAAREAHEEGGVEIELGDLLGVFAHDHPDRVHVIYAARPSVPTPAPVPVHTHEVSESRWVSREEADALLPPHMRRKLAACLETPGRTWRW